jgi:hypothetical protein
MRGIGLAREASGAAQDSLILGVPGPLRRRQQQEWPGSRLRILPDSGAVIIQNRIGAWRV